VAVIDPSRTSVQLSEDELRDAAALLADGEHDVASRAALEAAGILRNGAIVPYVATLLRVVAEPSLRIVVERYIAERVVVENVWAVERLAVWGTEGRDGGVELRPLEPALLPWQIMSAVGLGPRARAAVDTTLRAPVATFEGVEKQLAADDREAAEALLGSTTQCDEAERRAFIELMIGRRSTWRASSVWTDASGPRTQSVAVVDGGDGGLWLTTHDAEAGREPMISLQPALPSAVWQRILDLVPAGPDHDDG
jgi:hypothetical protein